jgi:hypothetical protein
MPPQPSTQLRFPVGGLVRRMAYQNQTPYTTPFASNIWPDDASLERERGGVRPGIEKAFTTDTGGSSLNMIADVAYAPTGNYAVKIVVANGGILYYEDGTGLTAVTPSPALTLASDVPLGFADLELKLYIVGDNSASRNLCVYNPADNTLVLVEASAGTIPTKCRLMCNFNNRIVLAGDETSPQNIYASRQLDPTDWDFGADAGDLQKAFALNASDQGRIGEPVMALIPHSKSCMIVGCSTSIWAINGDLSVNGTVEKLADNIGVVDAKAWCYDADGFLYMLSQDGLYFMPPGCGSAPRSISRERLPQELLNINRLTHRVSMAYDNRYRGIFLTVTTIASGGMTGYWIDTKQTQGGDSGGAAVSFWPTSFATSSHQPFILHNARDSVHTAEGPGGILMGCRDGYVRRFNRTVTKDDGTDIIAILDIGPFPLNRVASEGILQEIQVNLGAGSGKVSCQIRTGNGAEAAYNASARYYQTLTRAGQNPIALPRLRGQSAIVRFSNLNLASSRFSIEDITIKRIQAGRIRV